MKTFYHAVCDKHKSMCCIFVNDPIRTKELLEEDADDIKAWLELHYGCDLRLVHHEEDLEPLLGVYESTDEFWEKIRLKKFYDNDTKNRN
jgi:hypothetical protein